MSESKSEREGAPPREEKKEKRRSEKKEKPKGEQARMERKLGGVVPPPLEAVREFVKGQSYVTPFVLAEGFGLKVGVAKRLLRELEQERAVSPVLGDRSMKIYTPAQPVGQETREMSQPPPTRPEPGKRKKRRK